MLKDTIIRSIGDRVFSLGLSLDDVEAIVNIEQYHDERVAQLRAAHLLRSGHGSQVSDYYTITPPFNTLSTASAHLRAVGLIPWGTMVGHILVKKTPTATALIPHLNLEFTDAVDAIDNLADYYSTKVGKH